jgi:uncharacterized protein (TIGR00369 family)
VSEPVPASAPDPAATLRAAWHRLAPLPGGRWLFSRLVGRLAPYTGTMGARVLEFAPGRCAVRLAERRRVRNHLGSIHAIALTNAAELAIGLAVTAALPAGARAIVTRLEIDFLKKARGAITARAAFDPVPVVDRREHAFDGELTDADGDVVARARVTWLIQPAEEAASAPGTEPAPAPGLRP